MLDEATWTERLHAHTVRSADYRTPYDVDYSRVAHSQFYRKLASKSQILGIQDGDYHRNRLTHTIEVGQIALGLIQYLRATEIREPVRALLPSRALMETISAVHDIGHPPYGHGGEVALNYCMREHGGFEGNGQTLRILSRLLEGSSTRPGGNLTRNTLLGALKYPVPYSMVAKEDVMKDCQSPITGEKLLVHKYHEPPKCYLDTEADVVQWLMSPFSTADQERIVTEKAKTLPASLMDLADDCAYGPGDAEDAITLGLITRQQFIEDVAPSLWGEFLDVMSANYPHEYQDLGRSRYDAFLDSLFGGGTKEQCGRLIHYMISNSYIRERQGYEEPMYRYTADIRPTAKMLLDAIKKTVMNRVIRSPEVQQLRFKGQQMIVKLFAYYQHDPRHLLPTHVHREYAMAEDEGQRMRVICDFVASMTDTGMIKAYQRLFSPAVGSVFDDIR
jgi:dGTPase